MVQFIELFQLNLHHLILFGDNGVNEGDEQILIFFAAKKLFKGEIDAGIYFAYGSIRFSRSSNSSSMSGDGLMLCNFRSVRMMVLCCQFVPGVFGL
jgi:hypothetical protein